MSKKRRFFPVFTVLYVIITAVLMGHGIWYYFIRSDNSQIAAFSSDRPESSVKPIFFPPSPTPRLDELEKLVYEQLKKEAAEAEAKKIARKEK